MVFVSVLSFVPLQSILYLAAIFKKKKKTTTKHYHIVCLLQMPDLFPITLRIMAKSHTWTWLISASLVGFSPSRAFSLEKSR